MKSVSLAAILCVGFLISALTLPLASSGYAHGGALSACTDESRKFRNDSISVGASITYGDSLDEVALYRLVTGIDQTLLDVNLRSLSWYGTPSRSEEVSEAAIGFADLLLPADQLVKGTVARARYFHAGDMLMQRGLRSYRPERGGPDNAADWWLHNDSDPVYRDDDFAGWLQSMAASDTFHRIERQYGRAYYRPLISSWTYFDPKRWDVERYDRVTAQALEKWRKDGKLVWAAVAFSRVRTDQPEADALIDWFNSLHRRVKACAATKEEFLLYPLFRFHTLRLLFMRAVYLKNDRRDGAVFVPGEDARLDREARTFYDRAIALLGDPVTPISDNRTISDAVVATRAALLMTGRSASRPLFYPETKELLAGTTPHSKQWRDLRWVSAESFDDYLKLAVDQEPADEELEILNGLSTAALYRLIEGNAFTPKVRRTLAESAWVRAYLLGQDDMSQRLLGYFAANHAELQADARVVLDSPATERPKESLLFLLRHPELSVQIDAGMNSHSLWCNGLGMDAYRSTLSDIMGPVLNMAELPQFDRWWAINYWYEYDHYERVASSPAFDGQRPSERWPRWLKANFNDRRMRSGDIVDDRELTQLGHLPLPRDLLIERVLDWAADERSKLEPLLVFFNWKGDQRVAEALHLAIRNTRNICRVGDPHRMSRAAWIVLHDNPLWKSWADRTPYWYN